MLISQIKLISKGLVFSDSKNSVSDEVVGVGGKLAYIRAYYALL